VGTEGEVVVVVQIGPSWSGLRGTEPLRVSAVSMIQVRISLFGMKVYISTLSTPALTRPRRVYSRRPVSSLKTLRTLGPPLSPLVIFSSSVRMVLSAQNWDSFNSSGKNVSI